MIKIISECQYTTSSLKNCLVNKVTFTCDKIHFKFFFNFNMDTYIYILFSIFSFYDLKQTSILQNIKRVVFNIMLHRWVVFIHYFLRLRGPRHLKQIRISHHYTTYVGVDQRPYLTWNTMPFDVSKANILVVQLQFFWWANTLFYSIALCKLAT